MNYFVAMNYQLREERPTPREYVALREAAGMKPRTVAAARRGLPNTLYAVTVRVADAADEADFADDGKRLRGDEVNSAGDEENATGVGKVLRGNEDNGAEPVDNKKNGPDGAAGVVGDDLVGMGRVIGDDGCFYQLADVAVHPDHQRQGLGTHVVSSLLEYVAETAPPSAYVSFISDVDGFYEQFGFRDAAPESKGMFLRVGDLQ